MALTVVASAIGGCSAQDAPPLSVSDVVIVAPLPGKSTSVAYGTLHNSGKIDAVLASVSSPDFQNVELHETSISNGVARMQRIESLPVAANSRVHLEQGGKHLMLMGPLREFNPGDLITLHLHFDDGGPNLESLLILQAPLTDRADFLP